MNNNLPWDIIIAKFEGISLSEEEQSQLQNWLAADDKNKLLFDELKTLWDSIQAKSANYNPDVDYYWKKFQAYIHKDTIQKEPIKVKKIVPRLHFGKKLNRIAAAISLLLIVSGIGYYFFFI